MDLKNIQYKNTSSILIRTLDVQMEGMLERPLDLTQLKTERLPKDPKVYS
jgi:hypothetical protein